MTILYVTDETKTIYCISQNCVFQKRSYEELLWAEIQQMGNDFVVMWEDDWTTKYVRPSLEEAKRLVENNHLLHKPHINGASYEI